MYSNYNRFKFRYWDEQLNHMSYELPEGYSVDLEFNIYLDGKIHKQAIPFKFLQATEFKDRNGKIIYELDFLKRYKKSGAPYDKIYKVCWGGHFFDYTFLKYSSEMEIIGNIYETPEFLIK